VLISLKNSKTIYFQFCTSNFGGALFVGVGGSDVDLVGVGADLGRVDPGDLAAGRGARRHRLEGGHAVVVADAGRAAVGLGPPRGAAQVLAADGLVLAAATAAAPGVRHQNAAERVAELGVEDRVDHRVEGAVRVAQPGQHLSTTKLKKLKSMIK